MRRLVRHRLPSLRQPSGFTLIELVIVMGILVMVLTTTYRLILDCLDAERTIDKLTIPEKVGEGILALFRSDLSGTIWRHSGTRVFFVTDNGSGKDARDEIRFLSTVEPTPVEDLTQGSTVQVSTIRTITGLAYFLKQGGGIDGVPAYTLFRKEIIDFTDENPLEAPGTNYEVYDKIAYLSIECFDSYESLWSQVWDSEAMINEELADLEAENEANAGIAAVEQRDEGKNPRAGTSAKGSEKAKDPKNSPRDPSTSRRAATREQNALTKNAPGADPTLGEGQNAELLPPAAVPSAVRIEIGIYSGQGGKIERDGQGTPIVKTYATIVPILTAQRVKIEPEEDDPSLAGGGIAGATDPEGGPGGSSGGSQLGGPGQPRAGQGGADRRGAPGRGGRARPGPGGASLPRLPGLPGGAR